MLARRALQVVTRQGGAPGAEVGEIRLLLDGSIGRIRYIDVRPAETAKLHDKRPGSSYKKWGVPGCS
jgi:hypothetical protein